MEDANNGPVIASFEKNSREEVRLSVDVFRGRKIINIRVFYRDDDGEWKPGRQGLSLAVERYRDLADALLQLGEYLQKEGLLT